MNGFSPELVDITGLKCLVRPFEGAAAAGLLVLLHGVGAHERTVLPLAEPVDAAVQGVSVRSRWSLAPGRFGWFPVQFTPQGPRIDATAAEVSRKALVELLTRLQEALGLAPQRTVIAGFSQGGILSASVALTAQERVGGFGILSGRDSSKSGLGANAALIQQFLSVQIDKETPLEGRVEISVAGC